MPLCDNLSLMGDGLSIQLRRVGERRTRLLRRLRSEYEIVIRDAGAEVYHARTIAPSAALVSKGKVHTTDSWDWVRAADAAYTQGRDGWVSNPFDVYGSD